MSHAILPVQAACGELASTQYGLLTLADLSAVGLSPGAIHRRVRSGALIKMLPGIFRIAGVPRSWHQRAMAVYLWAGDSSAIGGTAAAALHRLDGCAFPSAITLMTSRSLKSPSRLVVVRRPYGFNDRVREVVDRIGVTNCTRTLIDLSAEVSEAQLELALEDARRRRLVTPASLEEKLAALPPNQPGRHKLLKLLAVSAGTRPSDSGLEVKVLRLLRQQGYPEPIRQEILDDNGEFAGRVDLAYPERRLIIEVQSHRWHDSRHKVDADSERHNRHNAMGWTVMKATNKMLHGEGREAFLRDLGRTYHRPLPSL